MVLCSNRTNEAYGGHHLSLKNSVLPHFLVHVRNLSTFMPTGVEVSGASKFLRQFIYSAIIMNIVCINSVLLAVAVFYNFVLFSVAMAILGLIFYFFIPHYYLSIK